MACLYCGKEVGPIRLIRDTEFCSGRHRAQYKERLRKALLQMDDAEPPPPGPATFLQIYRTHGCAISPVLPVPMGLMQPLFHTPQFSCAVAPMPGHTFAAIRPKALESYPHHAGVAVSERIPWTPAALRRAVLPQVEDGWRAQRAPGAPVPIQPESVTAALDPKAQENWIEYRPLWHTPAELPAARGVSGLRDGPLSEPAALDFSLARRSPEAAAGSSECRFRDADSAPLIPALYLDAAVGNPAAELETAPVSVPPAAETWALQPTAAPVACQVSPVVQRPASLPIAIALPAAPILDGARLPAAAGMAKPPSPCPAAAEVSLRASLLPANVACSTVAPSLPAALTGLWMPAGTGVATPPPPCPAAAEVLPRTSLFRANVACSAVLPSPPAALAGPWMPAGTEGFIAIPPDEPLAREVNSRLPEALAEPAKWPLAIPQAVFQPEESTAPAVRPAAYRTLAAAAAAESYPANRPSQPDALPFAPVALVSPFPALAATEVEAARSVAEAGFVRAKAPVPAAAVFQVHAIAEPVWPERAYDFDPHRARPEPPVCDVIPLEYHAVRKRGSPLIASVWMGRRLTVAVPAFAVRLASSRVDEIQTPPARPVPTAVAEVISMPQSARVRRSSAAQHVRRAIAASVLVTAGLWLGSQGASLSRLVINRDASAVVPNVPRASTGWKARSGGSSSNPALWARNFIAQRAAVQVTDTFHRGMAAWGSASGLAAGWSRHPDGYVKPGELALFQPALSYRDYRLEFFGGIEKLGIGWAVRAQDRKNYYAMKFKVLAPGLRPVLSMVYYPVVGGKPGHRVEVPLSVMVHNNQPYHVAVQVSGNRVTASIEGQEVDSWTDDLLPSGTVGFFGDAGESARLYWMRVSKNDDFLGRVCAFLSGNAVEESTQIAAIVPDHRPSPQPARPIPAGGEPALLARSYAATLEEGSLRTQAALNGRKIRTWSS